MEKSLGILLQLVASKLSVVTHAALIRKNFKGYLKYMIF